MNIFSAPCAPHERARVQRLLCVTFLPLVAAYVIAGLLTLHNDHYWGDDWAQYVGHARNIAQGTPYSDTGYLFNPSAASIGPAVSQPGLPALLAPVYALFGQNLLALKATEFFLLCGGIALAAIVLTDSFGVTAGLLAAALFALHPAVLWLRQIIITEPPFILFSFLAIFLAERRWRGSTRLHEFSYAILAGLALLAAFATRKVALALLAAIVLSDLVKRRRLLVGTVPLVAIFAAGALLLQGAEVAADYSTQLHYESSPQSADFPLLSTLWKQVTGYLAALGEIVPMPFRLSTLAATVLFLLASVGVIITCWKTHDTASSAWRSRLISGIANCPLEVWYLGAYLAALIVLPVYPDVRLLLPILPIIFAAAIVGAGHLLARTGRLFATNAVILLVGLCIYVTVLQIHAEKGALRLRADSGEGENGAFCSDCKGMYAFIAAATPPDARVAFAKPRALALMTRRASWSWSRRASEATTLATMRRLHISYVVVPREGYVLKPWYPDYFSWKHLAARPDVSVVFANNTFRIYLINWG